MDVIIQIASVVVGLVVFLLIVSAIIWLFYRPLLYSYRLSPDGIDIMLLSVYRLHRINFSDITDIRVGGYVSELMFLGIREFRRRKKVLDKFHPTQVMVITTTNEKITHWVLSTTYLEHVRNYTNIGL
jgi:hypothetical protein